ncbi:YjbQ family protein [Candidatus Bathyarchaeota archaeon]|nr:MAG: YjbQ family protein [Candidatus Bathyarchaeota archaeon]
MGVYRGSFSITTKREGEIVNITGMVEDIVRKSGIRNGVVHVFAPHATGVIVITEYESGLLRDIINLLDRLIPKGSGYSHPVNAHSHLRSMFLCPDRTIPLIDGRLALGTWQSIMYIEVDTHGRRRQIVVTVVGE